MTVNYFLKKLVSPVSLISVDLKCRSQQMPVGTAAESQRLQSAFFLVAAILVAYIKHFDKPFFVI